MSTLPVIHKSAGYSPSRLSLAYSKLKKYLNNLFRPEVVEVTFKMDGDTMTYTYTKVEEKKVA